MLLRRRSIEIRSLARLRTSATRPGVVVAIALSCVSCWEEDGADTTPAVPPASICISPDSIQLAAGENELIEALGVTTMNAAVDQAYLLAILVRNPDAYELLTRTTDDKEVREIVVRNPDYFGQTLSAVNLPGDLLIMALRRDGQLLVPRGNTVLRPGDHLTVVGSLECVEKSRDILV